MLDGKECQGAVAGHGRTRGPAEQEIGIRRRWWRFTRSWLAPEIAVSLIAGLIFVWRVGSVSPWRDEAATMVIADRTVPQILSLTRTIDLVHLAYYLIAHRSCRSSRTRPLTPRSRPSG